MDINTRVSISLSPGILKEEIAREVGRGIQVVAKDILSNMDTAEIIHEVISEEEGLNQFIENEIRGQVGPIVKRILNKVIESEIGAHIHAKAREVDNAR